MKKTIVLALTACVFAACSGNNTDGTTNTDSVAIETQTAPPIDNTMAGHTPSDGDITYNSGRLQVYRTDRWEDADADVTLDNGVVVRRNGRVIKDNDEYEWEEGYVVDRRGNVWDRTGNALSDAWDATKYGAKRTGQAIGNTAERAGEKVKDAVDGKDNRK